MKPVRFEYVAPSSLAEALAVLDQAGWGGKVLAGGQSLVPMMNFRLVRPEVLVDLNPLADLAGIEQDAEGWRIGAMTRHAAVESAAALAPLPVMARTARLIGHWAIRNRGTVGGSLAHADPAAEWGAVLTALGATVEVARRGGTRTLAVADLIVGPLTTALEPNEIITAVRIPRAAAADRWGIYEVVQRPGDFALVGAVARVAGDDVTWTWFGLGGRPETRSVPGFGRLGEAERTAALKDALAGVNPQSDGHVSGAWRQRVAVTAALRAYADATGDHAQGGYGVHHG
ncbi:MAG: FAD binding domain-containing protein [Actinomycetia bacterium]|nr:FAD binding domain-containing protein [Actinomycetes bacterium]